MRPEYGYVWDLSMDMQTLQPYGHFRMSGRYKGEADHH